MSNSQNNTVKQRMQHLRGTKGQLDSVGSIFTPLDGELILEQQTNGFYLSKIGNGVTFYKDLPYSGVPVDSTLTVQRQAADAKAVGDQLKVVNNTLETVDGKLKELEDLINYKPIEIKSFTVSPNVVEIGTTVTTLNFEWALNKNATLIKLGSQSIDVSKTSTTLSGQNITSNTTWTLSVTDEKSKTANKSVSLFVQKGVYYGVVGATNEITNGLILGLEKAGLYSNTNMELSFEATTNATNERVIFALPTSDYNDPIFKIGGFEYVWDKIETFNFTNASGHTESYTVWRSVQPVVDTLNITAIATKK